MRLVRLGLLMTLLALAPARADVPPVDPDLPAGVQRLDVMARPVLLIPDDPAQARIGPLRYLGGVKLSARHPQFGGFSGLAILDVSDNVVTRLLAVTDQAHWLTLDLLYSADLQLSGVANALIAPVLDRFGQPMAKADGDSEGLALRTDADGGQIAGLTFENRVRLAEHAGPFSGQTGPALVTRPTREVALPTLGTLPFNSGPEAFRYLGSAGDFVVITEGGEGPDGSKAAMVRRGEMDIAFGVRTSEGFAPTDVAVLAGERLLLLTRRYNPFLGVAAELSVLDIAGVTTGEVRTARTVVRLAPPLSVDNFEGLAVQRVGEGRYSLFLISDDNFNAFQSTLLLHFLFEDKGPTRGNAR